MLLVNLLVSKYLAMDDTRLILLELLEAVRASLRAKVNALAEDNWMYEAEEDAAIR